MLWTTPYSTVLNTERLRVTVADFTPHMPHVLSKAIKGFKTKGLMNRLPLDSIWDNTFYLSLAPKTTKGSFHVLLNEHQHSTISGLKLSLFWWSIYISINLCCSRDNSILKDCQSLKRTPNHIYYQALAGSVSTCRLELPFNCLLPSYCIRIYSGSLTSNSLLITIVYKINLLYFPVQCKYCTH